MQNKILDKDNPAHIAFQVRSYFEDKPEIVAVYIFGSHAKGTERKDSDVDLAVLIDNELLCKQFELKNRYTGELSRILRKDLHILIMNNLGELILGQIFKYSQCIVNRNPEILSRFKMIKIAMIAEFEYYRKIAEEGFLRKFAGGSGDRT